MRRSAGPGALVSIALAAVSLALLWPLRRYGLALNDDGWVLHPVLRMLEGEVLYRDVWTFYAPLRHHLLAWLLEATGPSLLTTRTVWIGMLVASVVATERVARRLVPASVAWVPALLYAVVPGPWHKAPFGFCTVVYLLALARFLEARRPLRAGLLGVVVGFSLVMRQELGIGQLALTGLAVALPVLLPASFGVPRGEAWGQAWRLAGAFAAGFLPPVGGIVLLTALRGALPDMLELAYGRAFLQMGAHETGLWQLLSPSRFALAREGRLAGALLLLPPAVYAASAVLWWRDWRRHGPRPAVLLHGILLLYAVGTVAQIYRPTFLLRLLQSALPFHLLTAALLFRWVERPAASAARRGVALALPVTVAAAFAAAVFSVPRFHPTDQYSGSWRMAGYRAPVEILGETVLVAGARADEIAAVRAFFDENVPPRDPVFAAPNQSTWYLLLDRPNPTPILGDHVHGDFVIDDARKARAMRALLASPATTVLALREWFSFPFPPDRVRRTLEAEFLPVREFGLHLVMQRGRPPELAPVLSDYLAGRLRPGDLPRVRRWAEARPRDTLPRQVEARLLLETGRVDEAVAALRDAHARDPGDRRSLVLAGRILLRAGRPAAAEALLAQALAEGGSHALETVLSGMPAAARQAVRERAGRLGRP